MGAVNNGAGVDYINLDEWLLVQTLVIISLRPHSQKTVYAALDLLLS